MMTLLAFGRHFLFGSVLFACSSIICWMIIRYSTIKDIPNQRSSHAIPTPTIGGVAIIISFFLGMGCIYFFGDETMIEHKSFKGFVFASLLIAGISAYDDYKHRPICMRMMTQVIGICFVMYFGIVVNHIDLPFLRDGSIGILGYVITFFWIFGLTNAYNFMDGLNGMAGANAVVAAVFFAIISLYQGSNFTYIVCYALAAGTAGFLRFNFPKGRIFMGDVGSTFLGFTFATLAIISSLYDNAHTSLLVVPLLLFHFIYDTLFTFIRRLLNNEKVFQAHRTHLYQLLNQIGYSHAKITLLYCGICAIQGLGALWMVNISGLPRLAVFIPFLIIQILYSFMVIRTANEKGIL